MRNVAPAFVSGLIFGAGLLISDMVNPARVLAFLDVAGPWSPILGFVMIGAIAPLAIAYLAQQRMRAPLLDREFHIPKNKVVDRRLLGGAALFGAGWGLVGFCPGPAIAVLPLGQWQPWLFVAAMLGGMLAHRLIAATGTGRPSLSLQTASDG